jgi:hypothetical protein
MNGLLDKLAKKVLQKLEKKKKKQRKWKNECIHRSKIILSFSKCFRLDKWWEVSLAPWVRTCVGLSQKTLDLNLHQFGQVVEPPSNCFLIC